MRILFRKSYTKVLNRKDDVHFDSLKLSPRRIIMFNTVPECLSPIYMRLATTLNSKGIRETSSRVSRLN